MSRYESFLFNEMDTAQEQLQVACEKEGFEVSIKSNEFPIKVELYQTFGQLAGQETLERTEPRDNKAAITFELSDGLNITMKSGFKVEEKTLNKFKNRAKTFYNAYLVYNLCANLESEGN